MTAPYLEISDFAAQYGGLGDADTPVATRLLQIVSDWIRANAPGASAEAAQQVVFEVVRDSLNLAEFAGLKQFENSTSRRTQSGTFADGDAGALLGQVVTDRQKRLLGVAIGAAPAYQFGCDDLAMPHERRGLSYNQFIDGYC